MVRPISSPEGGGQEGIDESRRVRMDDVSGVCNNDQLGAGGPSLLGTTVEATTRLSPLPVDRLIRST